MADAVAKTSTPDAAAGNPIDVTTVTTGAGVVDRQIVGIGDPSANNKVAVSAAGALSDNIAQVAGTTVDSNSGLKSAGTLRVVLATDQPALTNKLLVTPDSVALPANQSVNAAQLAGTTTDTNSGNKSAGTLRVVLATDQPALTNKLLVTPDSVALPANQSVNVAQFGGTNVSTGVGAGGAGIPRVTLSSDSVTAELRAATLHVTGTALVNVALTITLPAAGAGLFHYITSIQWHKLYSVVGIANGAGILITSTNLPGNPIWTTEQLASVAGTCTKVIDYQPTTPLKCSAANTNTTVVAPLQLQTIWRGNVSYFTAA